MRKLQTPLCEQTASTLRSGDRVLLSGVVFTARDAAHKRMVEALSRGETLPFPAENAVLYYIGPTPAPAGLPIGSAGPTTSARVDSYTPALLKKGVRGMIGKGARSQTVIDAIQAEKAVYFAAVGGAGAVLAGCVTAAEPIAYEDLGPEAVFKLTVSDLPLTVVIDTLGNNLYETGPAAYLAARPITNTPSVLSAKTPPAVDTESKRHV